MDRSGTASTGVPSPRRCSLTTLRWPAHQGRSQGPSKGLQNPTGSGAPLSPLVCYHFNLRPGSLPSSPSDLLVVPPSHHAMAHFHWLCMPLGILLQPIFDHKAPDALPGPSCSISSHYDALTVSCGRSSSVPYSFLPLSMPVPCSVPDSPSVLTVVWPTTIAAYVRDEGPTLVCSKSLVLPAGPRGSHVCHS